MFETLQAIDLLPDATFEEIVYKYVKMNIAHPFLEGNGRSTRIWLDLLLKKLGLCVNWAKIDRNEYLSAMRKSPYDLRPIYELLKSALTKKISD